MGSYTFCIVYIGGLCYSKGTMLLDIWYTFLYQPVFNALIWIYSNWAGENLGWAVIILTLLLRAALLPFTIINERTLRDNQLIGSDVAQIKHDLANDPMLMKEEIRKALKKRKLKPWAKAVVLGMQALVLVLLYQVFIQGITGEQVIQTLYPFIDYPGKLNVMFYGFNIGMPKDILWSGIVAVFLMAEVYMDFKEEKKSLTSADLLYFILFPAAVFVALYILPMVKALFILTSIIFSAVVHQFAKPFLGISKKKEANS